MFQSSGLDLSKDSTNLCSLLMMGIPQSPLDLCLGARASFEGTGAHWTLHSLSVLDTRAIRLRVFGKNGSLRHAPMRSISLVLGGIV